MLRSSMFFVLVTSFSIVLLESSVQGEEERVTRFLEKAIEHAPDEQSLDFVRIAFLQGYNENWEAALDFIERSEERLGERNPIRDQFFQLIILSGHTSWLEEHQIPVPWETNKIYASRAVYFAREGNAERAIEFAEKIKSQDYSHKIYCEVTKQLCRAGENEAARGVFMRALNQKEGRVSHELFQAALALQYRPLVLEMFQRLVKQENLINIPPLDLLAQMSASGFLTESIELSASFGELSLSDLPFKMWRYALKDQTKKKYERLMVIAGDPNDVRLKDPASQSNLFRSLLASGDVKTAEAMLQSRTSTMSHIFGLIAVSGAYLRIEETASSLRLLNRAEELSEEQYLSRHDKQSPSNRFGSGFHVSCYANIGALRILSGDVTAGERLLHRATTIADNAALNQQRKSSYPHFQLIQPFLTCDRPVAVRDILINAVVSKKITERVVAKNVFQLRVLIDALVAKGGRHEALKILDVLKSRTPRVTIIKLTAQAQLHQEGPDADLDWVLPRRKDVPIEELFLHVAEEELAEKSKEINTLLDSISHRQRKLILQ